ncbi:MAG: hypothetical protein AB1671_16395 [Thermodesulfobacteriota bacterium]|jgi:hypothetical protein
MAPCHRLIVRFDCYTGIFHESLPALLELFARPFQGQDGHTLPDLQALAAHDSSRHRRHIHHAGQEFQEQIMVQLLDQAANLRGLLIFASVVPVSLGRLDRSRPALTKVPGRKKVFGFRNNTYSPY